MVKLFFYYENIKFVVEDKKSDDYFNKFDIYLKNSEKLVLQYVEKKLSNNEFIFDGHTKPQSYSINRILIADTGELYDEFEFQLLKLDNNLSKKLEFIFGEHEIDFICFNMNNKSNNNITSESVYKTATLPKCQQYYLEFCENNKEFDKMYSDDYKLFNRAI